MLEYGAAGMENQRAEYHSVFNSKFQGSLGTNRERLKTTWAHTPQDWKPTLGLLLGYRDADPDIRELVENRFPGILDGTINTLDILLDPKSNKSFSRTPPPVLFPLATSFLDDPRFSGRYTADKAFDDDLDTAWVEGDDGPGLGEKIAFEMPPDVQKLEIFAGYGEERYHLPNNRVKKAVLGIYVLRLDYPQIGSWYVVEELKTTELHFEDTPQFQTFPLDTETRQKLAQIGALKEQDALFAVLEIKEFYPGAKWNDTCIAEIKVIGPDF